MYNLHFITLETLNQNVFPIFFLSYRLAVWIFLANSEYFQDVKSSMICNTMLISLKKEMKCEFDMITRLYLQKDKDINSWGIYKA